jgi:protein SCO1/2
MAYPRARAGLLAVLVALVVSGCGQPAELIGTPLGSEPAPDFTLINQFGRPLAMRDLRGKVVVLTFLYTSCPDTCPIIASKMAQVHDEFGEQSEDLAFVIVSVDPKRDTVPRVRAYLEQRGAVEKLTYLTGDARTLRAVWKDYAIGVIGLPPTPGREDAYEVPHVDAVYVIDRQGRERALMQDDFVPADLARNLQILLREGAA